MPRGIIQEDFERVTQFKLLGVIVNQSLKWNDHILSVRLKANSRIYFLKSLKRAGLQTDYLSCSFKSIILTVLEYASAVWHSSLTQISQAYWKLCKRVDHDSAVMRSGYYNIHQLRQVRSWMTREALHQCSVRTGVINS